MDGFTDLQVRLSRPRQLQNRSGAKTELKEYPDRSHFLVGEPGWDQADYVLDWAEQT